VFIEYGLCKAPQFLQLAITLKLIDYFSNNNDDDFTRAALKRQEAQDRMLALSRTNEAGKW
jgi:hypothetical protein